MYRPPHQRERGREEQARQAASAQRAGRDPASFMARPAGWDKPTRGEWVRPDPAPLGAKVLPPKGKAEWSAASASGGPSTRPGFRPPAARGGGPAIQAPRDLRRTERNFNTSPAPSDMELLASVSRSGGGNEAGGDALKDFDTQERFRRYIDERIRQYHAADSTGTDASERLQHIVRLFRKLREGIVASSRLDSFAIEAFESSVRYAILAHDAPQLLSALNGLVPDLYRAVAACSEAQAASEADQVATELAAVSLQDTGSGGPASLSNPRADNRTLFASLLLIYHLVHSPRGVYQSNLEALTTRSRYRIRARIPDQEGAPSSKELSLPASHNTAFVDGSSLCYVRVAARALAPESFDPLLFRQLVRAGPAEDTSKRLPHAEPLERELLAWAAPAARKTAGAVMCRTYMSCGVDWAAALLGLEVGGVETWALANGVKVVDGLVKFR